MSTNRSDYNSHHEILFVFLVGSQQICSEKSKQSWNPAIHNQPYESYVLAVKVVVFHCRDDHED